MDVAALIEQLCDFETPLLANTIGYIDPTPAHAFYMAGSISAITPSLGPTAGVAFTCIMDASSPEGAANLDGFWRQLEEMKKLGAPSVWVVKTAGSRPDHECVMGDGMGRLLHAAGCRGIVTDGGVRDVTGLLSLPFAAYARGRTVHHTAMRVLAVDVPVEVGGITVNPGDIIHANVDGVIRIPPACLETLPGHARNMRALEQEAFGIFKRTDRSGVDQRDAVTPLLQKYGFTHDEPASPHTP